MNLRPYVIVARVLEGEMEGLLNISRGAVERTMPYFEVVRRRQDSGDDNEARLVSAAELISATWRHRGPSFVEIYDAPAIQGGWWPRAHPIVSFYDYLRQRGVEVVPITALDRLGDYRQAFLEAVRATSNGIGVRLYVDDLEIPTDTAAALHTIVTQAGCTGSDLDVVINLERLRPDRVGNLRSLILDFFAAVNSRIPPRSITLVASSVPEDLSGIPKNGEALVRRLELPLWKDLGAGAWHRGLRLRLGDYGIVRPEYIDRKGPFPNINARLIYTLEDAMLVLRGVSQKTEPLEDQYTRLIGKLAKHELFRDGLSWGDNLISASARWARVSGRPSKWISVCTSHHVELASNQTVRILNTV